MMCVTLIVGHPIESKGIQLPHHTVKLQAQIVHLVDQYAVPWRQSAFIHLDQCTGWFYSSQPINNITIP